MSKAKRPRQENPASLPPSQTTGRGRARSFSSHPLQGQPQPARSASPPRAKAPVVRFVLGFLVLLGIFYAIYSPTSQTEVYKSYLGILAQISAWTLRGVGYTIDVSGRLLECPSPSFSLEIVPGCDGMEALALFGAAVLASPVSLRSRLVFAAIGSAGVFAINIFRIVSLFLVGAHFPKRFEVLHWDLWPGLLILVIMSSWMIWARRAFRAHAQEATQRNSP